MLASGLIVVLYVWTWLGGLSTISEALRVSTPAAIAATIVFITAATAHIWSPRDHLTITATLLYGLLTIMVGLLLVDTGLSLSPFIALWMLLAVFAPALGGYGSGAVLVGIAAYLGLEFTQDNLSIEDGIVVLLMGLLPLALGYMAWPPRMGGKHQHEEDRAYSELASELSAVSGQSEIVIAAISDGVISINGKGEIQLINPAAQKMIGWGKSDALGLSYKSVLKLVDNHDQAPSEANDPIVKAASTNLEAHSDKLSIVTADSGKKFLADITASPVGSMGAGLIIVFRDITKERAAEREQAEFISTASHEMRTPVASIEGYLGLALNPATATVDDKARDFIGKAHTAAQHLGRLFQDLLDVTKADDGRLSNNPGIIDVVAFVGDIVQGQQPRAAEKGLHLSYKPVPAQPAAEHYEVANRVMSPMYYVKVDSDHLREIVGNLIENAIKYTPEGEVVVDVTGDDNAITISVQDSGIGIPQEDISHLFQKFYRVDNSDTREIGGTGLGLYLCRRLVEAIGGKIWVESTYRQGSTFYVRLPRLDAVTARQEIEKAGDTSDEPSTPTPEVAPVPPAAPQPASMTPAPQQVSPPQPAPTATTPPSSQQTPAVPPAVPSRPSIASSPLSTPVPPRPTTVPPRPTSVGPSAPVFVPGTTASPPPLANRPDKYVGNVPDVPDTKH